MIYLITFLVKVVILAKVCELGWNYLTDNGFIPNKGKYAVDKPDKKKIEEEAKILPEPKPTIINNHFHITPSNQEDVYRQVNLQQRRIG